MHIPIYESIESILREYIYYMNQLKKKMIQKMKKNEPIETNETNEKYDTIDTHFDANLIQFNSNAFEM